MTSLIVLHDCQTIQLTRGKNALVDADDAPKVRVFNWYAAKSRRSFYAHRTVHICGSGRNQKTRVECMHRVLTGAPAEMMVDHRDGDGLNNTRSNLRFVTKIQNCQNQRNVRQGTSKYKGVCRMFVRVSRAVKWRANIKVDGKQVYLGQFWTEIEAANAYDAAALKYFGEFAATNAEMFGDQMAKP